MAVLEEKLKTLADKRKRYSLRELEDYSDVEKFYDNLEELFLELPDDKTKEQQEKQLWALFNRVKEQMKEKVEMEAKYTEITEQMEEITTEIVKKDLYNEGVLLSEVTESDMNQLVSAYLDNDFVLYRWLKMKKKQGFPLIRDDFQPLTRIFQDELAVFRKENGETNPFQMGYFNRLSQQPSPLFSSGVPMFRNQLFPRFDIDYRISQLSQLINQHQSSLTSLISDETEAFRQFKTELLTEAEAIDERKVNAIMNYQIIHNQFMNECNGLVPLLESVSSFVSYYGHK